MSAIVVIVLGAVMVVNMLGGLLGAADQAHLENSVLRKTGEIPDLLVVGVALAAWVLLRIRTRRTSTHRTGALITVQHKGFRADDIYA